MKASDLIEFMRKHGYDECILVTSKRNGMGNRFLALDEGTLAYSGGRYQPEDEIYHEAVRLVFVDSEEEDA